MSTAAAEMLSSAILVVAHPDDEILWFSSVVDKVDEILFCFGDYPALPALGEGRRKALAEYPLEHCSSLQLEESGSFSGADWGHPVESPYGLEIVHGRRTERRYRETYRLLEERLAEKLATCRNVITHNPWGEYGHEDHVQVYRAVEALQKRLSFRLWFSNYASNRSAALMFRYFSGFDTHYLTLPTNRELAHSLKSIYERHGCWTWYGGYQWFDQECFTEPPGVEERETEHGRLFPINMLKTDLPSRPWKKPGPLSRMVEKLQRRLQRKLRNRKSGK